MKSNIFDKLDEAKPIPENVIDNASEVMDKQMEKVLKDFKQKQAKTIIESENKIII